MTEEENQKLDNKIIEWHKRMFPDSTLETEMVRLYEEIIKYENGIDLQSKINHLANIYIIAESMTRWNCEGGLMVFRKILAAYYSIAGENVSDIMFKAIKNRMAINNMCIKVE